MKLSFSSIVLCSSVSLGLSLPFNSRRSLTNSSRDISTASGASSNNNVSLRFESPCDGCFIESETHLLFNVAIQRAERPCQEGHILVNGQEIEGADNIADRGGTIQISFPSRLGNHQANATWKASCIADEAQILSLQIHQVGHEAAKHGPGFTISFKQQDEPEVIRLLGEAVDISYSADLSDQWLHPVPTQRFTLAPGALEPGLSSLENELGELEALKAKSKELQTLIQKKKRRIHQLFRDDFRKFCSTIKECDSLKCILRLTMHKLPEYAHLLSLHFQHHRPSQPVTASSEDQSSAGGISNQGEGATFHGDQERLVQDLACYTKAKLDTAYLAPSKHDESFQAPVNDHQDAHFVPSPKFHLLSHIIPTSLLLIIIGGVIFLTIRHTNLLCASPRCRASRLCSREERRKRRAYRRAAFEHACRNWWNRYRRPSSTADYDEKRNLILQQEAVLEDAMQDEMRGLRLAHEIVENMFHAEEGRSTLHHQANMLQHSSRDVMPRNASSLPPPPPPAPTTVSRVDNPPAGYRRFSSGSSQSGYSLPPPHYEQELELDMDVVDGFMYSPTFGNRHTRVQAMEDADDATPDSSVVDCSPRMSFDTGRTSLTVKERD